MATVGLIWTSVEAVTTRREIAHQAAQERCKGATDSDCQSLVANRRSAAATEASADLTGQQLWLNLFALLGLGATIYYARNAWIEARKSADAARESTDAALKAFEADNRTWLTIRAIEVVRVSVTGGTPNVQIKLEIKNIGPQPAFNVQPNFGAFVSRGATIGIEARDEVISLGGRLATTLMGPGVTLLTDEVYCPVWTSNAEIDPHTEARIASIFKGVDRGFQPRLISAAYSVHYRSPASDRLRYSAGVITLNMKDRSDFPDDGIIPNAEIEATLNQFLTKMT